MTVPPRQFAPHVRDQIKSIHNSAFEHRKQGTAAQLRIIEVDLPRLAEEGREAMASLLQNDSVHRRQLPGYLDFTEFLGAYRDALNVSRFDIETAVALVKIGEAARREVMRFVERQQPTDSKEVYRIANRWRERSKSDDESTYHDVLGLLTRRRIRALRKEGMAFNRLVPKLHDLMIGYDDKSPEQKEVIRPKIIEMAMELRERFQKECGTQAIPIEDWGKIENPADRALAEADHALEVLAAGDFDQELPSIVPSRDFPFPLFPIGGYLRSWHAIDSIGFLARRGKTSSRRYAKRPLERLSAVDVCGGVGSGALGLKSSGFFPSLLLDGDKKNVDSFLASRKGWRARAVDINKPQEVAVAMESVVQSLQGRELDLIMGSLPTKPWRIKGPINYDEELHSAAMTMVEKYKPRAFFFEHSEGLTTRKHAKFYLPMTTFFAEQGYYTTVFSLNHPEFGIPQERTSYFLVGVKNEFADRLYHPIVRNPLTPTVAHLIAKVAFPYRTVKGYAEVKDKPTPELTYNNWSSAWLRTHGQNATGDLSGAYTENNRAYWADRGFELFPETDAACEVGTHPAQLRIPMTTSVIKALQGLPKDWIVRRENLHDTMSALCLTTPPVITAAVARSVHAALTGEQVDLDTEGALKINASPFLHHPHYVDDMGDAKGQLAFLWRKGILTMRGDVPVDTADNDPDLSQPPKDLQLGQEKFSFKKRPT